MSDSARGEPPPLSTTQVLRAGGVRLSLRVADADRELERILAGIYDDHPDRNPYWGHLWPSAKGLVEYLQEQGEPPAGARTLELGTGCGAVGLFAAARGAPVVLGDVMPESLRLARQNAEANGLRDVEVRIADLRDPDGLPRGFERVLVSDLLYEAWQAEALLEALECVLLPGGRAFVADPHRRNADLFPAMLRARGFLVRTEERSVSMDKRTTPVRVFVVDAPLFAGDPA